MLKASTYGGWDFEETWEIDEGESLPHFKNTSLTKLNKNDYVYIDYEGSGTTEEPYIITTEEGLQGMRYGLYNHYRIEEDITITKNFIPIGLNEKYPFTGSFEGGIKDEQLRTIFSIKNLQIESDNQGVGLFGYIDGGTLRNLSLTIKNLNSTYVGSNTNKAYVGGIVGYIKGGELNNIEVRGNIQKTTGKSDVYIGGIAGYFNGTEINRSDNWTNITGEVSNNVIYSGGISGYGVNGKIIDNINLGRIYVSVKGTSGNSYVGGTVGYANNLLLEQCESQNQINVNAKENAYVGGIIGYANNTTTKTSYSISDIDLLGIGGSLYSAGGLVGFLNASNSNSSNIENSYSAGDVIVNNSGSCNIYVGGLVGRANSSSSANKNNIVNTYTIGKVIGTNKSGTKNIGGLIGDCTNTDVAHSYWSPKTTGVEESVAGEMRSIEELLHVTGYENWDFNEIWDIDENLGTLAFLRGKIGNRIPNEILAENLDYETRIKIRVKDDQNFPISGVEFCVKDTAGNIVNNVNDEPAIGVSDEKGICYIVDLPQNTEYIVEETNVPGSYKTNKENYRFKIDAQGKTIDIKTGNELNIVFINERLILPLSVKNIETNEGIQGVRVGLYDANGDKIIETTDANGNVKFEKIPAGTYTYKVEIPSDEYKTSLSEYRVTISQDGTIEHESNNDGIIYLTKKGLKKITVELVDIDNPNEKVKNAKLEVSTTLINSRYLNTGEVLYFNENLYTNDTGIVTIEDKEIKAYGYINLEIKQLGSLCGYKLISPKTVVYTNSTTSGFSIDQEITSDDISIKIDEETDSMNIRIFVIKDTFDMEIIATDKALETLELGNFNVSVTDENDNVVEGKTNIEEKLILSPNKGFTKRQNYRIRVDGKCGYKNFEGNIMVTYNEEGNITDVISTNNIVVTTIEEGKIKLKLMLEKNSDFYTGVVKLHETNNDNKLLFNSKYNVYVTGYDGDDEYEAFFITTTGKTGEFGIDFYSTDKAVIKIKQITSTYGYKIDKEEKVITLNVQNGKLNVETFTGCKKPRDGEYLSIDLYNDRKEIRSYINLQAVYYNDRDVKLQNVEFTIEKGSQTYTGITDMNGNLEVSNMLRLDGVSERYKVTLGQLPSLVYKEIIHEFEFETYKKDSEGNISIVQMVDNTPYARAYYQYVEDEDSIKYIINVQADVDYKESIPLYIFKKDSRTNKGLSGVVYEVVLTSYDALLNKTYTTKVQKQTDENGRIQIIVPKENNNLTIEFTEVIGQSEYNTEYDIDYNANPKNRKLVLENNGSGYIIKENENELEVNLNEQNGNNPNVSVVDYVYHGDSQVNFHLNASDILKSKLTGIEFEMEVKDLTAGGYTKVGDMITDNNGNANLAIEIPGPGIYVYKISQQNVVPAHKKMEDILVKLRYEVVDGDLTCGSYIITKGNSEVITHRTKEAINDGKYVQDIYLNVLNGFESTVEEEPIIPDTPNDIDLEENSCGIVIKKYTNAKQSVLKGIEYDVTTNNNGPITYTTDEKGSIYINDIKLAEQNADNVIKIKEKYAGENYKLDETEYTITITGNKTDGITNVASDAPNTSWNGLGSNIVYVNFKNDTINENDIDEEQITDGNYSGIILTKHGETKDIILKNVQFNVFIEYKNGISINKTYTTDKKGKIGINNIYLDGMTTVKIKEISTNPSYELDETEYNIIIFGNQKDGMTQVASDLECTFEGNLINVDVYNKKKPEENQDFDVDYFLNVNIYNRDANNKYVYLDEAIFALNITAGDRVVCNYDSIITEGGIYTEKNIPLPKEVDGVITLTQTAPPEDYIMDGVPKVINFHLKDGELSIESDTKVTVTTSFSEDIINKNINIYIDNELDSKFEYFGIGITNVRKENNNFRIKNSDFRITDQNGLEYSKTMNSRGTGIVYPIPVVPGETIQYVIRETKTVYGYIQLEDPMLLEVTFDAEGRVSRANISNQYGYNREDIKIIEQTDNYVGLQIQNEVQKYYFDGVKRVEIPKNNTNPNLVPDKYSIMIITKDKATGEILNAGYNVDIVGEEGIEESGEVQTYGENVILIDEYNIYGETGISFKQNVIALDYERDETIRHLVINRGEDNSLTEVGSSKDFDYEIDDEEKIITITVYNQKNKEPLNLTVETVGTDCVRKKIKGVQFNLTSTHDRESIKTDPNGIDTVRLQEANLETVEYTLKPENNFTNYEHLPNIKLSVTYDAEGFIEEANITEGQDVAEIIGDCIGKRKIHLRIRLTEILEVNNEKIPETQIPIGDKYNVTFVKEDADNKAIKLQGVEFEINEQRENGVTSRYLLQTNTYGKDSISYLTPYNQTTYTITETATCDGYILDDEPKTFTIGKEDGKLKVISAPEDLNIAISNEDRIITVRIKNQIDVKEYASITFEKVDSSDSLIRIANVGFKIEDEQTKQKYTLQTNEEGFTKIIVPIIKEDTERYYTINEIGNVPQDYVKYDGNIRLHVVYNGNGIKSAKIVDEGTDYATVTKVDSRNISVRIVNDRKQYIGIPDLNPYTIKVVKVDENNIDIVKEGAELQVSVSDLNNENKIVKTDITNEEGIVQIDGISRFGDFKINIDEQIAPANMQLESASKWIIFNRNKETGSLKYVESNNVFFDIDRKNKTITLYVTNKLEDNLFTIVMNKIGITDNGEELGGIDNVKFELKLPGIEQPVGVYTAKNGFASITNLKMPEAPGKLTYILKETEVPKGYVKLEDAIELEVTFGKNNEKMCITGVEIKNNDGNCRLAKSKYTQTNNGEIIKEKEILSGKMEPGNCLEIDVLNKEIAPISLNVEKVDADDTNKKLSGAKFNIEIKKAGVLLQTIEDVISNENGRVEIDNIRGVGELEITITETEAPTGYNIAEPIIIKVQRDISDGTMTDISEIKRAQIDNENGIINVQVKDKLKDELEDWVLTLNLRSVCEVDGKLEPLPGAEFNLKNIWLNGPVNNSEIIDTGEMKNGFTSIKIPMKVIMGNNVYTTYDITETKVPQGYDLLYDARMVIYIGLIDGGYGVQTVNCHREQVMISFENQTVDVQFIHTKTKPINLEILKTSEIDAKKLEGAKFNVVVKKEGETTIYEGEVTTNEYGIAKIDEIINEKIINEIVNEGIGKYRYSDNFEFTITETEAPPGYEIAKPINFTILRDRLDSEISVNWRSTDKEVEKVIEIENNDRKTVVVNVVDKLKDEIFKVEKCEKINLNEGKIGIKFSNGASTMGKSAKETTDNILCGNIAFEIYDQNGNKIGGGLSGLWVDSELENYIIKTGDKIKVNDEFYPLVVIGDVDKNGKLTITDLLRANLALNGLKQISEIESIAADTNKDGKLSITDIVQINLALLGIIEL